MSSMDPKFVITTVSALLTGGGLAFIQGVIASRKKPPFASKDGARAADQVDASILAVARARDELEDENDRLRRTHAKEREEWEQKETRLRAEVDRLTETSRDLIRQLEVLRQQIGRGGRDNA